MAGSGLLPREAHAAQNSAEGGRVIAPAEAFGDDARQVLARVGADAVALGIRPAQDDGGQRGLRYGG